MPDCGYRWWKGLWAAVPVSAAVPAIHSNPVQALPATGVSIAVRQPLGG